uniref:TRASH domain-containing protein n=1 Tax=Dicentrarchus labrax TaxID=13489 RepID=A0A8C4GWA1_DICLA
MVHKAQSSTVSGRNSPSFDKNDIKEVKPSLLNLDCIKQEPIDEEYKQSVSPSISTEDIKDEPNVIKKEDLKIGSVFSLTGVSTSTAPTLTHRDLPASCSNCKKVLMDGETVYQRKAHSNIFCSTPCLLKFYQTKQAKKTCHFCLQAITQPKDVLQAPVDNEETMKDFCSQTCLSSFNYKTIMSTRISIVPVIKHEILQQDVVHKICSDPCFFRFCNMNNLSVCENCRSNCNTPVMLKMENGSIKLCSAECLVQFKQKIEAPQPCAMCSTPHLMSDMVENKNSEDVVELFCTNSCVMAAKIQAVSASVCIVKPLFLTACHLAMSDASIRNFCTLTCAMAFKFKTFFSFVLQETQNAATSPTAASDQTQCDFLKPPEKLPCAQCRRILKTTPKVVQKKGKMNFVCSQACSQEFKRVNNTMGKCEFCKNERIIKDVKRVNDKDCYFCSDGCIMLFCHELEERWGEYCHLCAYCLSTSKTLVTAQYKGVEEEFCSEECNSNYNMLFCHLAKCDTCGREGKLRQSLPMLGEVKHFCDLKCLLHFCNKKVQMVNKVSSPPKSAGTVESSPVIANVISLAGTLAKQPDASASSAQHGTHSHRHYVNYPDCPPVGNTHLNNF